MTPLTFVPSKTERTSVSPTNKALFVIERKSHRDVTLDQIAKYWAASAALFSSAVNSDRKANNNKQS